MINIGQNYHQSCANTSSNCVQVVLISVLVVHFLFLFRKMCESGLCVCVCVSCKCTIPVIWLNVACEFLPISCPIHCSRNKYISRTLQTANLTANCILEFCFIVVFYLRFIHFQSITAFIFGFVFASFLILLSTALFFSVQFC